MRERVQSAACPAVALLLLTGTGSAQESAAELGAAFAGAARRGDEAGLEALRQRLIRLGGPGCEAIGQVYEKALANFDTGKFAFDKPDQGDHRLLIY